MLLKKRKPPATQRNFTSPWGELDYVCKKTRFWLYVRKQRAKAERYVPRLKRVLHEIPDDDVAILRQEGLALLHELRGEIRGAIAHRKREIALMKRLHREAASPSYSETTRAFMLRDRDSSALEERKRILASLEKENASKMGHMNHKTN